MIHADLAPHFGRGDTNEIASRFSDISAFYMEATNTLVLRDCQPSTSSSESRPRVLLRARKKEEEEKDIEQWENDIENFTSQDDASLQTFFRFIATISDQEKGRFIFNPNTSLMNLLREIPPESQLGKYAFLLCKLYDEMTKSDMIEGTKLSKEYMTVIHTLWPLTLGGSLMRQNRDFMKRVIQYDYKDIPHETPGISMYFCLPGGNPIQISFSDDGHMKLTLRDKDPSGNFSCLSESSAKLLTGIYSDLRKSFLPTIHQWNHWLTIKTKKFVDSYSLARMRLVTLVWLLHLDNKGLSKNSRKDIEKIICGNSEKYSSVRVWEMVMDDLYSTSHDDKVTITLRTIRQNLDMNQRGQPDLWEVDFQQIVLASLAYYIHRTSDKGCGAVQDEALVKDAKRVFNVGDPTSYDLNSGFATTKLCHTTSLTNIHNNRNFRWSFLEGHYVSLVCNALGLWSQSVKHVCVKQLQDLETRLCEDYMNNLTMKAYNSNTTVEIRDYLKSDDQKVRSRMENPDSEVGQMFRKVINEAKLSDVRSSKAPDQSVSETRKPRTAAASTVSEIFPTRKRVQIPEGVWPDLSYVSEVGVESPTKKRPKQEAELNEEDEKENTEMMDTGIQNSPIDNTLNMSGDNLMKAMKHSGMASFVQRNSPTEVQHAVSPTASGRVQFFRDCLTKLCRVLSNGSVEEIAKVVKHMQSELSKYPLPTEYHGWTVHDIQNMDMVSQKFIPQDVDDNIFPVRVGTDGDCLFYTFSVLVFGRPDAHIEMRVRCILAMCLDTKHITSPEMMGEPPDSNIISYLDLLSRESNAPEYNLKTMQGRRAMLLDVMKRRCKEKTWAVFWHIAAMACALNNPVRIIYPHHTVPITCKQRTVLNRVIVPPSPTMRKNLNVMWTWVSTPLDNSVAPNHFVPCLYCDERLSRDVTDIKVNDSLSHADTEMPSTLIIDTDDSEQTQTASEGNGEQTEMPPTLIIDANDSEQTQTASECNGEETLNILELDETQRINIADDESNGDIDNVCEDDDTDDDTTPVYKTPEKHKQPSPGVSPIVSFGASLSSPDLNSQSQPVSSTPNSRLDTPKPLKLPTGMSPLLREVVKRNLFGKASKRAEEEDNDNQQYEKESVLTDTDYQESLLPTQNKDKVEDIKCWLNNVSSGPKTIDDLENQVSDSQQTINRLHHELKQLNGEGIDHIETEVKLLEQQLGETKKGQQMSSSGDLHKPADDLREKQNVAEYSDNSMQELQGEIKKLSGDINKKETSLRLMKEEIQQKDTALARMKDDVKESKQVQIELQQRISSLQEQMTTLLPNMAKLKQQLDIVNKEKQLLEKEKNRCTQEVNDIKAEYEAKEKKLHMKSRNMDISLQQTNSWYIENKRLQRHMKEQQQLMEKFKDDAKQQMDDIRSKLEEQLNINRHLQIDIGKMQQNHIDELSQNADSVDQALQENIIQQRDTNSQHMQTIANLQTELDVSKVQAAQLSGKAALVENERDQLTLELGNKTNELREAMQRIESIEINNRNQLQIIQTERDNLLSQLKKNQDETMVVHNNEMQALKQQLESLKHERDLSLNRETNLQQTIELECKKNEQIMMDRETEKHALQVRIQDMQSQIDTLHKKNMDLIKQDSVRDETNDMLIDMIKDQYHRQSEHVKQLESKLCESSSNNESSVKEIHQLEKLLGAYKDKEHELKLTIAKQEQCRARLDDRINELENEAHQLKSLHNKAKNELQDTQHVVSQHQVANERFKSDIENLQCEVKQERNRFSTLKTTNQNKMDDLQNELDQLRESNGKLTMLNNTLTRELKVMSKGADNTDCMFHNEELDRLKQENETLKHQAEKHGSVSEQVKVAVRKEWDKYRNVIESLQTRKNSKIPSSSSTSTTGVNGLGEQVKEMVYSQYLAMLREISDGKAAFDIESLYEKYSSRILDRVDQLVKTYDMDGTLKKHLHQRAQTVNDLEEVMQDKETEIQQLKKMKTSMEGSLRDDAGKLARMTAQLAEAYSTIQTLTQERDISRTEQESQDISHKAEVAQLRKQLSTSAKKVHRLEDDLEDSRAQASGRAARLKEKENIIADMRSRLEDKADQLMQLRHVVKQMKQVNNPHQFVDPLEPELAQMREEIQSLKDSIYHPQPKQFPMQGKSKILLYCYMYSFV